jgi:Arc/MetJ-type ribon-helix-helix transcriptional regulator
MARVLLEIPDSQRDKWDRFVEGSGEFRSQADLIRTEVERYIATDGTSEADGLNDAVTQIREQVPEVYAPVRQIAIHLQAFCPVSP